MANRLIFLNCVIAVMCAAVMVVNPAPETLAAWQVFSMPLCLALFNVLGVLNLAKELKDDLQNYDR